MPKYRSVSQYNTYSQCAYRYKLGYIDKVWKRPASWLSQGIAVHAAMEEWEKSGRALETIDLIEIYKKEFRESVNEQAEVTPDFAYWFGSGRYGGAQDIERRFIIGKEQLLELVAYCEGSPEEKIWTAPNGDVGIELGFNVELGGVMVRGFIDQVIETPSGLRVRDIKTGAKPGDTFQLAAYAEALKQLYDVDVNEGDYLMGKTGKPTAVIPITEEDKKQVHETFKWLDDSITSEKFEPNPSKKNCVMCDVRTSCEFAID